MTSHHILRISGRIIEWTLRLAPAAAFLSLLIVLDGGLRWLGVLGIVPLFLALRTDTMRCGPRGCRIGGGRVPGNWPAP